MNCNVKKMVYSLGISIALLAGGPAYAGAGVNTVNEETPIYIPAGVCLAEDIVGNGTVTGIVKVIYSKGGKTLVSHNLSLDFTATGATFGATYTGQVDLKGIDVTDNGSFDSLHNAADLVVKKGGVPLMVEKIHINTVVVDGVLKVEKTMDNPRCL